jgi:hypothetical protein
MVMKGPIALVLSVFTAFAQAVFVVPKASAITTPDYTDDRLTTSIHAKRVGGLTPVLRLPARRMAAGSKILLTTRLAARSNAVRAPRMAARIDAIGAGRVLRSPVASLNHVGRAGGIEYVVVRWLLVAPVSGTYTITMRAEATTVLEPVDRTRLGVVRGLTYLRVSNVHQSARQWGDRAEDCVGRRAIRSIPQCAVARRTTTALPQVVPIRGTTRASVVGDLELTREYGSNPGGTSVVDVELSATPARNGVRCTPPRTQKRRVAITSSRRHQHINMTILNINSTCGNQLPIVARISHLSGNPVTIHGWRESNGIALPYG